MTGRFGRRSGPDPDDYPIALVRGGAAALVSGDRHLLDLAGRIPVFTPPSSSPRTADSRNGRAAGPPSPRESSRPGMRRVVHLRAPWLTMEDLIEIQRAAGQEGVGQD